MDPPRPHVALLPSAGMGHLTPFSRLAASLSEHCHVTMVSILPTVSAAESRHYTDLFSSYTNIHPLHFQLPPFDSSACPDADPFFLRWTCIRDSASDIFNHLLTTSRFPISALVTDIAVAGSILPLTKSSGMPCYVLFTSSAAMLSFFKYFSTYRDSDPVSTGDVEIPGLRTVPVASLPRPMHDPGHTFTQLLVQNARSLDKSNGIIVNTFESFEPDSLAWLRAAREVGGDISFGSRTAMSKEQIRELGLGLEASGCRFVWVIKTNVVDTEDRTEVRELLGGGFLERVEDRGFVTSKWVEQEEVLRHMVVGRFVSHCGWNSVTEAAMHGVRVLAWPRLGDQRINAGM